MSRQLPRTRPARPALRRGPDRVQIGLDPECALVVESLSDVASAALLRLDGLTSRLDVLRLAPELAGVLDALHERGALDDDPGHEASPSLSTLRRDRFAPDLAALALVASSTLSAHGTLVRRARSSVVVRGNDRVAAQVAVGLAACGVGTVALAGPDRLTTVADLTAVGPYEPDVSWRDSVAESVRRQGAHPIPLGPRARRATVTLLCGAADVDVPWTDPEGADDLLADGLLHLPVAVSGTAARVGPLVVPGVSACLWCLDRRSCDLDAAWPALADQVRLRHATARAQDGATVAAAAAFAVSQTLQVVDQGAAAQPVTLGAQIELRGPDHLTRVVPVATHPVCGCGWQAQTDTMGA